MDARNGLAARIKEARERNGWQAIQVAEWCEISPQQLSRYESGTVAPDPANLVKLARGLRVTTDWLLGLEDGSQGAA
jgi:transcriptional regulator with XRE-family HTH domain